MPRIFNLNIAGHKVVRGRDWKWEEQDYGSTYGITSEHGTPGWISVTWCNETGHHISTSYGYRIGADHAYDLYFYEEESKSTINTTQAKPGDSVKIIDSNGAYTLQDKILTVKEVDAKGNLTFTGSADVFNEIFWCCSPRDYQIISRAEETSSDSYWEALMEEAKRRYPVGTVVRCLSGDCPETIKDSQFFLDSRNATIKCTKAPYTRVYMRGQWAEIVSKASSSELVIIAEAKERYKIGTQVKCLTGCIFEEVRTDDFYIKEDCDKLLLRRSSSRDAVCDTRVYDFKTNKWAEVDSTPITVKSDKVPEKDVVTFPNGVNVPWNDSDSMIEELKKLYPVGTVITKAPFSGSLRNAYDHVISEDDHKGFKYYSGSKNYGFFGPSWWLAEKSRGGDVLFALFTSKKKEVSKGIMEQLKSPLTPSECYKSPPISEIPNLGIKLYKSSKSKRLFFKS